MCRDYFVMFTLMQPFSVKIEKSLRENLIQKDVPKILTQLFSNSVIPTNHFWTTIVQPLMTRFASKLHMLHRPAVDYAERGEMVATRFENLFRFYLSPQIYNLYVNSSRFVFTNTPIKAIMNFSGKIHRPLRNPDCGCIAHVVIAYSSCWILPVTGANHDHTVSFSLQCCIVRRVDNSN